MSLSKENKVIIDGMTYYGGLNQPNVKFVKVNVDCWEKIFDYLSLEDVLAMSQTCQRMRQIGGHYFRENFHGIKCSVEKGYVPDFTTHSHLTVPLKMYDFLRFVDTVSTSDRLKNLQHYARENVLVSLKTLYLCDIEINLHKLHRFANVLNNVENIEFQCSIFKHDFCPLTKFLESCPKLKSLRFRYSFDFKDNMGGYPVFKRTYPMLVDFQCSDYQGTTPPFTSFLERNPSIKSLRIESNDLNKISFSSSTIRLNCLSIDINKTSIEPIEFGNRIRALYADGYFNTLRLAEDGDIYTSEYDSRLEMFINEVTSFSPLEVLYAGKFSTNICHLTELKELHIRYLDESIDLTAVAKNLIKLERLWIECMTDQLLPFLQNTKTLKMVIFHEYELYKTSINSFHLNEMRKMSGTKGRVQIGVREDNYLLTKWKATNENYDFVQITREDTLYKHFDYKDLHVPTWS